MKKDEVPQQVAKAFMGRRKALYATDERGNYGIVPSSGWEAEEIALDQAIAECDREAAEAHARVRAGVSSPLAYHMWHCRMDVLVLAQSTGFFQWRVRRHLKPGPWARLSPRVKQRYADALGCSVEQLDALPDVLPHTP